MRRLIPVAFATTLLLGVQNAEAARELAVPSRIPASPALIMSVPQASLAWRNFVASPFGKAALAYAEGPQGFGSAQWAPWREQVAVAEEALGFTLHPTALFDQTVSALDVYIGEEQALPVFLVSFKCTSDKVPGKVLAVLSQEADAANGVSGGFAAETTVKNTDKGADTLFLPAFQIYVAADGTNLLYSNSEAFLRSALGNEGAVLLESEFFTRHMVPLEDEPQDLWLFAESDRLLKMNKTLEAARGGEKTDEAAPTLEVNTPPVALTLNIEKDHFKFASFRPEVDMGPAMRRFALAAPPPAEVPGIAWSGAKPVVAMSSNSFDGLAYLDVLLESFGGGGELGISKEQVTAQIDAARSLVGFDVRNDLLANLGPDATLTVTSLELDKTNPTGAAPKGDLVLALGMKDRVKFARLVTSLEEMAKPPAPKQGKEAPPSPLKTEKSAYGSISYLDMEPLRALGVSPAWILLDQNMFLLATDRNALKKLLEEHKSGTNITASDLYKRANDVVEKNRNGELWVDLTVLGPSLTEALKKMPGPAADAAPLLEAIKGVYSTNIYKPNGEKIESVLLF